MMGATDRPDQLDMLGRTDDDPPAWRHVEVGGWTYRWRVWPDRVREGWTDTRDPNHPELWYRPPGSWAFEVEYFADCHGWARTANEDTRWRVWQAVRETMKHETEGRQ